MAKAPHKSTTSMETKLNSKKIYQVKSSVNGDVMTYFVGSKEECEKFIENEFSDKTETHRDIYAQTLYKNARITRATKNTQVDERLIENF